MGSFLQCYSLAVTSLKLFGEIVPYQKIAEEISAVKGVVTHGLFLDTVNAAVLAQGDDGKIVEKASLPTFPGKVECQDCYALSTLWFSLYRFLFRAGLVIWL